VPEWGKKYVSFYSLSQSFHSESLEHSVKFEILLFSALACRLAIKILFIARKDMKSHLRQ